MECCDFHCSQHSQQVVSTVKWKNDAVAINNKSSWLSGLVTGLSPRSHGFEFLLQQGFFFCAGASWHQSRID
jgi:hypothetical protein